MILFGYYNSIVAETNWEQSPFDVDWKVWKEVSEKTSSCLFFFNLEISSNVPVKQISYGTFFSISAKQFLSNFEKFQNRGL